MTSALLAVTLSAAVAAAAVAVRARVARPAPVPVRTAVRRDGDWRPHISSGCGR